MDEKNNGKSAELYGSTKRDQKTFLAKPVQRKITQHARHTIAHKARDATAPLSAPRSRYNRVNVYVADKTRCLKPGAGDVFLDCANCPEMVVAPPGSFIMGTSESKTERPQRRVRIATPFAIGRFQVTRAQFETFVQESGHDVGNKCWTYEEGGWQELTGRTFRTPGFTQDRSHPAVCVNWHDAAAYVVWLSKMTGKCYRLPSEAEWEYVARAGTTMPFWWAPSVLTDQANYNGDSWPSGRAKGKYRRRTVKVDTFQLNPWGL